MIDIIRNLELGNMMKTLVIGLGNPILTDDGVGVKVAYGVKAALAPNMPDHITVTEASVGGLRLMETMIGFERAIIVDALKQQNGNKPGKIHKMSLDDLRMISPTQHSASAHDTSLVTALEMGKRMGFPLPEDITIIAIEVENITDFNELSTPEVEKSIPVATEIVLRKLEGDL